MELPLEAPSYIQQIMQLVNYFWQCVYMSHSAVGVKPMTDNEGGRSLHKCVVTTPVEDGFFKITTSDGMSWKKDKEKRAGRLPTAVLHPFQEQP